MIKIISIAALILFASCSTQKKALRKVIKADVKYPTVVSGYCGTKYAPKATKGEPVVQIVKGEDRIDTFTHYDTLVNIVYKTIFKTRIDTVRVSVTDTVLNTALVDKMAYELDEMAVGLSEQNVEIAEQETAKKIWRNMFIGLATILALIFGIKFVIPKVLNRL